MSKNKCITVLIYFISISQIFIFIFSLYNKPVKESIEEKEYTKKYSLREVDRYYEDLNQINIIEQKYVNGTWIVRLNIEGITEDVTEIIKGIDGDKVKDFKIESLDNSTKLYIEMQW